MTTRLLPTTAALWLGLASLAAQTPPNLIGVTRAAPLVLQQDHASCSALPLCPAALPPAPPLPYVGGTAWDPTRSQVWISNGADLTAQDMTLCAPNCGPVPCPTSSPNAFCTGLAFVESRNELWILDSLGALLQCQPGCPPTVLATCNTGLSPSPTGAPIWTTGLAVDEGAGLVFYSTADFGTGQSWIHVARLANPCQILQTVRVPTCVAGATFGPATGLGVDWCRRTLFVTNGFDSQALRYTAPPAPLVFTSLGCCTWSSGPVADPLVGLCVRPGGATPHGAPCAAGCPACPMAHVLRNDPNLGNVAFTLGLDGAPQGQLAWCLVGAGPCTPPGVVAPPLCGPLYLPIVLGNLGPVATGGAGVCGGGASFALPLPLIPTLCGTTLSSQCAVLCIPAAGPPGTSLSPCLSWRLQGS